MSDTHRQQEQYQPPHDRDDAPITASKTIKPDGSLFAESVTIDKPADELWHFWRDQTNLVAIMDNVADIEPVDATRFRWTVKGPGGQTYSWVAAITHEEPGRSMNWQSEPDADIRNSGKIEFKEAGSRGTVVRAVISYDPPGGTVGKLVAKLFQREPHLQTRRDLHRFKQLMETGEIATSARNRRQRIEREEMQGPMVQEGYKS